jgi:hypothetical protein
MKMRDFDNATTQRKEIERDEFKRTTSTNVRKKTICNSFVSRNSEKENAGGIHSQ